MIPYIILAVALLAAFVIAVVAVGPARFATAWQALPPIVRTWINVTLGAAVAAAAGWLVGVIRGAPLDLPLLGQAVATAVGASIVRLLNPADTGYGIRAAPDPVGAHEVVDPAGDPTVSSADVEFPPAAGE